MEKAKKTSSFTSDQLFGAKDNTPKSSSSSTSHFGALFGQSSTGLGKDSMHNGITRSMQHHNTPINGKQESFGKGERNGSTGNDPNSYSQNGSKDPCYLSSSIYYGGQEEDYSAAAKNPNYLHKKDSGDDDSNANNATRGNWWQGSLYY